MKTAMNTMLVRHALKSGSLRNLKRPSSVVYQRKDFANPLMKVASQKLKINFEIFKNSP